MWKAINNFNGKSQRDIFYNTDIYLQKQCCALIVFHFVYITFVMHESIMITRECFRTKIIRFYTEAMSTYVSVTLKSPSQYGQAHPSKWFKYFLSMIYGIILCRTGKKNKITTGKIILAYGVGANPNAQRTSN